MTATRRLATIPIIGAALGLLAFGIVRGASSPGPAHGVRLRVAIDPPIDASSRAMAEHVARTRLEERGMPVRVVSAAEGMVIEIGEDDREIVGELVKLLERTATLELHEVDNASPWLASVAASVANDPQLKSARIRVEQGVLLADDRWDDLPVAEADAIGCTGRVEDGKRHCMRRGDKLLTAYVDALVARDPKLAKPVDRLIVYGRTGDHTWRPFVLEPAAVLDGRAIRHTAIVAGGVAIDVAEPSALARITTTVSLAFVFDGSVRFVAIPDRVRGTELHVPTPAASEDDAISIALDLVAVVENGAVHPMHVVHQEAFVRATGFFARAWLFLAIAAVLLIVAAFVWWRR